jgi:hypothetical protein
VEFFVYKTASSNIDTAEADVKKIVQNTIKEYNGRFQTVTILNTAESISTQFSELIDEFRSTIILVFINLFIFLGLRQASIASLTVPLTFMSAIAVVNLLGLSLNFLTLFAFLLALGLLIDDSIVRGTTSKQIVKALFDAGAREVHFMVSSPPVKFPDFYGIDTPKQEKLIAATHTRKQILDFLGANSLHYLSLAGLVKATTIPRNKLSLSCFTGEYPVDILERKKELGSV